MTSRSYSAEGIVIAQKSYSESDRIFVIYTRNLGKVSVLAKGIRKPKSKKRGHLDLFNSVRFSSSKTRSIDLVTEAETIKNSPRIRKNLKKMSLAYYFSEVLGKISREGEQNEGLYYLLRDYLDLLEERRDLKKIRMDFIRDVLITTGYWPKGKKIIDPDFALEQVLERKINSSEVGKRMFSG